MTSPFRDALNAQRLAKQQREAQAAAEQRRFEQSCAEFFSPVWAIIDEMHAAGVRFDGQQIPPANELRLHDHRVDIRLGEDKSDGATAGWIGWLTIVLTMIETPDAVPVLAWNAHVRYGPEVLAGQEYTTDRLDSLREWLAGIVADYEDKPSDTPPLEEPPIGHSRVIDLMMEDPNNAGTGS